MVKKILFGLLTALLALSLVGCGGGDSDTPKDGGDSGKKTETSDSQEKSANKAVLAYAQLYAYGIIEDENQAAAGLKQADIEEIQNQVLSPIVLAFQKFPLSDDNVSEMTRQYVGKLHRKMNITSKLKTNDPKSPAVVLTAMTPDTAGAIRLAETDENLQALAAMIGERQAQGLSEDDLKLDADFQKFAMESINAYIDNLPFNEEASIDVTCKEIQGSDGKTYWAPVDIEGVKDFVTVKDDLTK